MPMYASLTHLVVVVWTGTIRRVRRLFLRPASLQPGQGLVEYALILVLIALVTIGILTTLGNQTESVFDEIACVMRGGEYHRDRGNGNSNRCR